MPPGIQRVLDRLDTPAMVTNDLGEVLAQNPLGVVLLGDESRFKTGDADRSRFYRWFTDPRERIVHPAAEHHRYSRSYVAMLRLAIGRHRDDAHGQALIGALLGLS